MAARTKAADKRAVIKDAVYYGPGAACRRAPRGEYLIERRCDCVGFCDCNGRPAFTLSFDAFIQHLNEGRIALVG